MRLLGLLLFSLSACNSTPGLAPSPQRHTSLPQPLPGTAVPEPVTALPTLPRPQVTAATPTFNVSVSRVGVASLLFTLARDAGINLDLHPGIDGEITLNAVGQTLPQLLERICQQADLHWQLQDQLLSVRPDRPYLKTYRIDYVNLARNVKSTISIANAVESTTGLALGFSSGATANHSSTTIDSEAQHQFWKRLELNLKEMLGIAQEQAAPAHALPYGYSTARQAGQIARPAMALSDLHAAMTIADRLSRIEKNAAQADKALAQTLALQAKNAPAPASTAPALPPQGNQVLLHAETGTLTIRARHREQLKIADYLAAVQSAAQRQVLIEATVVEVALGDQYQAGIDWSLLNEARNWSLQQKLSSGRFNPAGPVNLLGYHSGLFTATVSFLEQFGRTRVLSSPKIIALNNQTAVMKVVDQQVYFTLKIEEDKNDSGVVINRTYSSEIRSVPVGLVMQVTPQIAESGTITLNIRPTITKINSYSEDPAVALLAAGSNLNVKSLVPNLQVREFDSTLAVPSGQVAVLGGLIQDSQSNERSGIPGLSRLPWIGDLFSYRDDSVRKNELVVFLRPVILRPGQLDPLLSYRQFSPQADFFQRGEEHDLSAFQSGQLPGGRTP